jgi:hypothetical protein
MVLNMEAARFGGGPASGYIVKRRADGPEDILPDIELQELRALWWRLATQGMRLPAECGVILLNGGQR